jgi:aminoglycoside phosphotransferase (APT) family kinase protein
MDILDPLTPPLLIEAAARFDIPLGELVSLGGETNMVFAAEDRVISLGESADIDREIRAVSAASTVLPVPEVLGKVELSGGAAMLTRRLPGRHAWMPDAFEEDSARSRGRVCGEAQLVLGAVQAPAGLLVVEVAEADRSSSPRLLHLDLHPLNILMDDDGAVTGVLDWTNAAGGDPVLDGARTATVLRLDPQARRHRGDPSWRAFVAGWTEAARLDELPAWAVSWACGFMLRDLAGRVPEDELVPVREAKERGLLPL